MPAPSAEHYLNTAESFSAGGESVLAGIRRERIRQSRAKMAELVQERR